MCWCAAGVNVQVCVCVLVCACMVCVQYMCLCGLACVCYEDWLRLLVLGVVGYALCADGLLCVSAMTVPVCVGKLSCVFVCRCVCW